MRDLSREAILRMVGLHDSAQFMRQINAIQLSLEEQDGQMVAYWTEIRKDERQITLVAGRVSANETSIGQLQVTATSLTASVSSLNTTVNGDGTQGSGLVSQVSSLSLTVGNINLSVQSLSTTVNGDGTQGSGLVSRVSSLELTESSISQRVGVIEGDYVKEAEISLMVKKDGNGYISNASIKADNIDFTFTRSTNFISNGTTVMNINSSGDLWIKGELKGGTIQGNYTIGTLGSKMEIYVDEAVGATKCSGIRGINSNNWEVIKLGMQEVGGNVIPSLRLNDPNAGQMYLYPSQINIENPISGVSAVFVVGWSNNKVNIYANTPYWPSLNEVTAGQVYLDNGYLKVRTS